ncbi:MAG: protein kinase domain-containing protein [Blastocatellia bacterium]
MKPLAQNSLIQNRYLIVHLIGKGGMGEVYLAVDQRLGSAIALKRTYFAGDEMLGNAFEREARILARMRHPVLPKVSDHFGEGDEQFLVMEHISGDDLSKRIEAANKPFPTSWVMFWADQLLDALSYLHSHEPPIIHRDIKPQNLKLTDENHIILLDFGLSKNSTGQTNIADSGSSTGSIVGYTPHYAPMEQIRGIGTSPKSDLYSLSATLYQLLTNTVPPDALSRADSMLNGLPDPITPLSEVNPEITNAVSDVILRGMEVSQEKRFSTAREMQKALRKAYSQIQDAMTAKTVAFNSGVDTTTETADHQTANVAVTTNTAAEVAAPQDEPLVDFDATIAFDPIADSGSVRQADVQTEVFLAGSNSLPIPEQSIPVAETPLPEADYGMAHKFSTNPGNVQTEFTAAENEYVADSTAPNFAFDDGSSGAKEADYFTDKNEYRDPGVAAQPEAFATVAASASQFQSSTADAYVSAPAPPAAVQAAPAKKKSSGKIFAIVGGLFALFILGAVVAGGAWFIYNNYANVITETEPTPSPEESIEPSPSPEPSVEAIVETNTNTNSNTSDVADSNSSTTSDDLTVGPTPAPTVETTRPDTTPVSRPTPQIVIKNTPTRPQQTPGTKATPKPKPRDDRTVILQ